MPSSTDSFSSAGTKENRCPAAASGPFSIGTITLGNRLVLAPLAGYSNLAFRLICLQCGAGLAVSEMISSHGLAYGQKKTLNLLQTCADENVFVAQLFGAEPSIMAEAATVLNSHKVDIVDINMGCPVKKVTKRGAGAALMADITRASEIIDAVISATSKPVTVKLRVGVHNDQITVFDLAHQADKLGAAAITVHGRTWKQGFSGLADWDIIRRVKRSVSIPVIGNGDITSYHQAATALSEWGCDAVMIGRAAIGNPWVFSPSGTPPESAAITATALHHLDLISRFHGHLTHSPGLVKNQISRYFKGFAGASTWRRRINESSTINDLRTLLTNHAEHYKF